MGVAGGRHVAASGACPATAPRKPKLPAGNWEILALELIRGHESFCICPTHISVNGGIDSARPGEGIEVTKITTSKDLENRESRLAESKDFPDPADSCDFGYTIVRAHHREEPAGAKENSEYEKP